MCLSLVRIAYQEHYQFPGGGELSQTRATIPYSIRKHRTAAGHGIVQAPALGRNGLLDVAVDLVS